MVTETQWNGLYRDGWKELIVSDRPTVQEQLGFFSPQTAYNAFEHPAKYSRALIQRIYAHLRDTYRLQPGATILDPFGGVALGGLDALFMGYHFLAVELEPAFVTLGHKNIEYWRHKYGLQPGSVTLLQGDSRYLREVLKGSHQAMEPLICVSSPPYAEGCAHTGGADKHPEHIQGGKNGVALGYAIHAEAIISSPPYAGTGEVLGQHNGIDYSKSKTGGKTKTPAREASGLNYGSTEGNLGNMATGVLVSSPPYGDQQVGTGGASRTGWRGYTDHGGGQQAHEGQLAAMPMTTMVSSPPATGSTFWSAAAQVLTECHALLAPGALAVWIVKPFVRDKQIVDFPAEWRRLCQAVGFTLIETIIASQVDRWKVPTLWKEDRAYTKSYKGFFRNLCEQKGAPPIDAEIILVFKRR